MGERNSPTPFFLAFFYLDFTSILPHCEESKLHSEMVVFKLVIDSVILGEGAQRRSRL